MIKQILTKPSETEKLNRKVFVVLLFAVLVKYAIFDLFSNRNRKFPIILKSSANISFEKISRTNSLDASNSLQMSRTINRTMNVTQLKIQRPRIKSADQSNCKNIILKDFTEADSELNKNMFFLETSGETGFDGRQSCALESAIRYSGFKPKVIMSTKFISMRLRPSMCNMVKRHYPSKIGFYGINLDYLFKNTPLDGVQRELSKQWMAVHSSDLMRQALVYKFGGYYADLDVITIRSLRRLHNVYPFEMFFPMK